MYQWLLGALGALLAAARRPAPAPPPPKRPPPRSASRPAASGPPEGLAPFWVPVDDPDKPPAKKRKSDHITSEHEEKVEEVRTQVKLPTRATKRRRPSVSDDAPTTESADETSFEPSAKRPRFSTLDVEILQIGQMPCGTNAYLLEETLPLSYKTIPCLSQLKTAGLHLKVVNISCLSPSSSVYTLYEIACGGASVRRCIFESSLDSISFAVDVFSTSENGKQSTKPASGSTLAPRPPIKELSVPESTTSEGSKMGRPLCTAEEDVQRGEKVKYKQLVEMAKEKYPRSRPNPQPTSFRKYSSPPAEKSQKQERPVKQAIAGKKFGAEISEDALFQARLAPGRAKKLPALDVEKKQLPSLEKTVEHFTPLTEAMEREVIAAFGKGEPDEIMSSAFKLKVTREDIHTLRNLCWLNDEIINFYMRLVVERNKKEGYPAVHAFSTFFYSKLSSEGYKVVTRWTRNVDLFKQDIILVPIHLRLHWTLAVIDIREKIIKYFDSMGQKGDAICQILLKYLQEESREKRNVELNISEWTIHSMAPHEIPQQLNGSDCGVFTCKYADYISRDKPMNFTQTHMPYFRRKMVWEIIHQQLL
ncbi:sentrin-specific protease 2 [Numenius arquata]|uniref:sentrin-specific protease 2 n=1 Tax=Numenius arquata TaxID=31919 RepID=UPI003D30CBAB